jgi:hypothetical protein
MNRQVEALLPRALEAVRTYLLSDRTSLIAHKEYDGYAANLGAAIRQSGLLPALSFFTDVHKMKIRTDNTGNEQSLTKPYRNILLTAILHTTGGTIPAGQAERGRALLQAVIQDGYGQNAFARNNGNLAVGAPNNPDAITKWRKEIVLASVAIKLALRSFQHTSTEQPENA